jgi:hypothetical protein
MKRVVLFSFVVCSILFGSEADELLEGFDDGETPVVKVKKSEPKDFKGKITQSFRYSKADAPHDSLYSTPSSLFLEYNKALGNNFKLKINAKAYYDYLYDKNSKDFKKDEVDEFRSEAEIYDFFIQGSLSKNLDIKVGRQVVVWGKSDTIRVTDVLNSLDNRVPGMVDIEDLRLPSGMVKLDYYYKNFHITPIMIVEQRFTENPPFKSQFYPSSVKLPKQDEPKNSTYAINIGGEFEGYDADLYLAKIYPQDVFGLPMVDKTKKTNFAGASFNAVKGSWLLKSELAIFKDLNYLKFGVKDFDRTDILVGAEYSGFADTKISLDMVKRSFKDAPAGVAKNSYQSALRVAKDFKNATLHANYLLTLNGKKFDEGGFQRAWVKYDVSDTISTNLGVVDYIGGSATTDKLKDNDMIFMDVSYHF